MVFTGSSAPSFVLRTALKAAAEGAGVGALGAAAAAAVFREPALERGIALGVGAAWLASSTSVGWLLWGRRRAMTAFMWLFGAGMTLHIAILAGLMVFSWRRPDVSEQALLLSYVFGLLAMQLTMETRYLKPR